MSLLFNMLSRFVIASLPRSMYLLILWLQSPSAMILELMKVKSVTVSIFSPSICHEIMVPDAMIFVFWMLSSSLVILYWVLLSLPPRQHIPSQSWRGWSGLARSLSCRAVTRGHIPLRTNISWIHSPTEDTCFKALIPFVLSGNQGRTKQDQGKCYLILKGRATWFF